MQRKKERPECNIKLLRQVSGNWFARLLLFQVHMLLRIRDHELTYATKVTERGLVIDHTAIHINGFATGIDSDVMP